MTEHRAGRGRGGVRPDDDLASINQALVALDPESWRNGHETSRTSILLPTALLDDIKAIADNASVRAALHAAMPSAASVGGTDSVSGFVRAASAAALVDVRNELLARAYDASAQASVADELFTDESLSHA